MQIDVENYPMLGVRSGVSRQISTLISDKIDVGSKRAKNRKDYVTTLSGFLQSCLFHGRNSLQDLNKGNEEYLELWKMFPIFSSAAFQTEPTAKQSC